MARSLAHEFEATTDLELGEQGRDVKFHGAFGEVQFVGDFLVSETAKDAIEDFLFTAGEAHGVLGAVAGFKKLLSFFGQAVQSVGSGRDHDEIILG